VCPHQLIGSLRPFLRRQDVLRIGISLELRSQASAGRLCCGGSVECPSPPFGGRNAGSESTIS
jgi:hypothetical protein